MSDLTGTATYDIFGAAPALVGAVFFFFLFFPLYPFSFLPHFICYVSILSFVSPCFLLDEVVVLLETATFGQHSIPGYVVF